MKVMTMARLPLAIVVSGVVLMSAVVPGFARGRSESSADSGPTTVFTIGTDNNLRDEFRESGFTGLQEYNCDATDCSADQFPMRIYSKSVANVYDDCGVAQLKLNFRLSRGYDNVSLRLARWGIETDLVKVDNRSVVAVTAAMLGSAEDIHGEYDLDIGPLSAGRHSIGIRVAEDNAGGSGRHSWDSISLTAW